VRELVGSESFEKFLNCVINDMTYCLGEGLDKIGKIKKFEQREVEEEAKAISKEDYDNNKQERSICKANF